LVNPDKHDITVKGRKTIEVTGVASVESFDVHEFSLITSAGPLRIEGTNLHMKHLDLQSGVVVIEGTLTNLSYAADGGKKPRLATRLFR
jgi:sporulation protein YabP